MRTAYYMSSCVCLALLASGCARDRMSYLTPGPIRSVDPEGWKQLCTGMTKQEVVVALGDPQAKKTEGPRTITTNGETTTTPRVEYWEYNWSGGMLGDPHGKAYVVYFDEEGRVKSFREPIEKD